MLVITPAAETQFHEVRAFYHTIIEEMEHAEYHPGWEKGVYPSDEYLLDSIRSGTLFVGRLGGDIVSAMIVNHQCNDGYRQVVWQKQGEADEISVIHALGVLPRYHGQGLAKRMVAHAISQAREREQKALRLDVLGGNLPALKLYAGMGFRYAGTVPMFYEDTGWTDFLLYEYPL